MHVLVVSFHRQVVRAILPESTSKNSPVVLGMAGPRAVLISGALVDVDLADAPTVFVARSRIAAVVGIPIGRAQLVDTSAKAQLDDAVQLFEDARLCC